MFAGRFFLFLSAGIEGLPGTGDFPVDTDIPFPGFLAVAGAANFYHVLGAPVNGFSIRHLDAVAFIQVLVMAKKAPLITLDMIVHQFPVFRHHFPGIGTGREIFVTIGTIVNPIGFF